jgi:predicted TIM-barrel fold metal-dependent hydrolase
MTVERLIATMDEANVDKAVLVQRGSIYGFDSSYVCDSAARFPERFAAVCSIDATRPDCGAGVHYWVTERGAAGIRLMELVRSSSLEWLDSPLARNAWAAAAELQVPVCVHFFPWNRKAGLSRLAGIMRDIHGLTVVIDHLGAIRSEAGPPDHGVDEHLEEVARLEGANVKFTTIPLGRLTQAGIDSAPIMERVMNLFGAERMMWGSDIAQSPGSYGYMVGLGRDAVSGMSSAQQEAVLGGTARRLYGRSWR